MAGILIKNGGFLRGILKQLGAEDWDCNWLITELTCYDDCGWEGCEKWAQECLFLSNRELLHDIGLRNMQFVWGILSAIPANYTKEQVVALHLPAFSKDENGESCYLADSFRPQHPLAFLEIMSEDSSTVTVIANDMEPLRPLFGLAEWTEDAELSNRRWHELLRKGLPLIKGCYPEDNCRDVTRMAKVWHSLYHHRPDRPICEDDIRAELLNMLETERKNRHG
ncbi:MAG: hypothetical protein Q4C45_07230 [Oscillospiraceae bacterium]|nr:hypothetical protein [Oscillospiraceae bacterium]